MISSSSGLSSVRSRSCASARARFSLLQRGVARLQRIEDPTKLFECLLYVGEKAELSVEAADLRVSVGITDMVNAASTKPGDLKVDELRSALSKALERFSAGGDART
jgi:hypothetical protein